MAQSMIHPLKLTTGIGDDVSSPLQHNRDRLKKLYNQRSQIDVFDKETFGSKAIIMKSSGDKQSLQREDPSCDYHLSWRYPPDSILLMKKFHDPDVTAQFKKFSRWLIEYDMSVLCEPNVLKDPQIKDDKDFKPIAEQLTTWDDDTKEKCLSDVDLIICIGGDGTLLYTMSMFQNTVPPVMSFNMGSLGFLTPFPTDDFHVHIKRVMEGKVSITLRHRLLCEITSVQTLPLRVEEDYCPVRYDIDSPMTPAATRSQVPSKFTTKVVIPNEDLKTKMQVMNEVVIDRGPSPYLTNLELFCNGRIMTSVQGDGIIIATPTGSTAYSLAAGASMVHPSVSCMVVTPICPHSLSFRSIVVPAGVEISVRVSANSRNSAWVAFDGRNRQEIFQGDSVVVTTSTSPVPTINNTGHVTDWFDSLAECLNWNVRKQQKKC